MPFEVSQTSLETGILLLSLSGTMTMGNQLQKFEWTIDEMAKNSQNKVVIDMSQLTYLDSSAIGVFVGCNARLRDAGGQLRLASVTDRVQSILKMTGLDAVLHIDPTKDASVTALTSA